MKAHDSEANSAQATAIVQGALIGQLRQPGPEHNRLETFIGRWINQGRRSRRRTLQRSIS